MNLRKSLLGAAAVALLGGMGAAPAIAAAPTVHSLPVPAKPAKHYHFTLITKSNASPYWLAVREGADAAAKKFGVSVAFEAPASGTDLAGQIGMVNNAVTGGTDGIILAAQNPQALLKPVKSALAHHIPVVTVDSGLSPNISDCFLATSNVGAAAALAKYTADHLMGGKGQYAIVDFNHTASTGIARPKGFMLGMKSYPHIKKMGPIQYSNNDVSAGLRIATTMLTQYPHLKVIFGANDRAALGPAEAVQRAHAKVKVVGFDADLGEIALVKAGIIQASILQSPYDMGYYAVVALLDKLDGKTLPKRINTPYFLLTPKNLGSSQATAAIRQYAPKYNPAG